jgi:uncharacterized protein (UPF0248 family)
MFTLQEETKNLLLVGEWDDVVFPREVLNQLKWGPSGGLERAEVTYLHRGAPGDEMTVLGSEVVVLERSFFCTSESKIPYHRIRRIVLDGKVLYDSSIRKGME